MSTLFDPATRAAFEAQAALEEESDGTEGAAHEWWWGASVAQVDAAAEEVDGIELDAASEWVSESGITDEIESVRWLTVARARAMHAAGHAIFLDTREPDDFRKGAIEGAWHMPMRAVAKYGLVQLLWQERVHELLHTRRHQLIIIYSGYATPFSPCRALSRWLLRAGKTTLPTARFRRLRGGLFAWTQLGQPTVCPVPWGDNPAAAIEYDADGSE